MVDSFFSPGHFHVFRGLKGAFASSTLNVHPAHAGAGGSSRSLLLQPSRPTHEHYKVFLIMTKGIYLCVLRGII